MKTIEQKLLNGNLESLTEEELGIVSHNTELLSLLISKIKEGCPFSFSMLTEEIAMKLFTKENISYYLEILKKSSINEYVDVFASLTGEPEEELEELEEGLTDAFRKYFEEHKVEILKLFINNKFIIQIKNPVFIELIIRHDLVHYIKMIRNITPSKELEDYVISKLDLITDKLNFFSERILDACLEKGKISLLTKFYKQSPRLKEAMIEAIDKGEITYSEIDYSFLAENNKNPAVMKLAIEQGHVYDLDMDTIREHPELITYMAERMISGKLEYSGDEYNEFPEIVAAKIITAKKYTNLEYIFKWYNPSADQAMAKNSKIIADALLTFINNNLESKLDVFNLLCTSYYDSKVGVVEAMIIPYLNTLSFTEYIKFEKMIEKYPDSIKILIYPNLYKLDFEITSLPEDFDFRRGYPNHILVRIVKILTIDQLDPNILGELYLNNTEVLEAIIERCAEQGNDKFNDKIYYLGSHLTPKMINIFLRKDNPLHLKPVQIVDILRYDPANDNIPRLSVIIANAQEIDLDDFKAIASILFNKEYNDGNYYYEFTDEKLKILRELLTCNKVKHDEDIYDYLMNYYSDFKTYADLKEPNNQEVEKLVYTFLSERKDIPLRVSMKFDQELRENSTYDLQALSNNPRKFILTKNKYPEDFILYVEQALKSGHPVDLYLFSTMLNDNNCELLNTGIFTFDDQENDKAILKLLQTIYPGALRVVGLWLSSIDITILFTDRYSEIFKEIVKSEYLLDILIDKSGGRDIIFSNIILGGLTNTYSYNLTPKINNFVLSLIRNRKIDMKGFVLTEGILNLQNQELEQFLVEEYFLNAETYPFITNDKLMKKIVSNPKYYEAVVTRCKSRPSIINANLDYAFKYKELKDILLEAYEKGSIPIAPSNISRKYFQTELMLLLIKKDISYVNAYVRILIHDAADAVDLPIDHEQYEILRANLPQAFNIKLECYDTLCKLYGRNTIKLLENANIISLLQQDVEIVEKFVNLFKVRKLDIESLKSINDSIQQHIYTKKFPNEVNLYTDIMAAIQNGADETVLQGFIDLLCQKDNNGNYLYLIKDLEFHDENEKNKQIIKIHEEIRNLYLNTPNKEEFLRILFEKIKTNQNIYGPILNMITSGFILERRNEVTRNEDVYEDTSLGFEYDERQLLEAKFKYLIREAPYNLIRRIRIYDETDEEADLDYLTIRYLHDASKLNVTEEEIKKIKQNIIPLKKRLKPYLETYDTSLIPKEYLKNIKKIITEPERKPNVNDVSKMNFETIMAILTDKEKYDCLIKILDKYKFLEWNTIFDEQIKQLSLGEFSPELYNFINAFNTIYENEMKLLKTKRQELIEETVKKLREKGADEATIQKYIEFKQNEPLVIDLKAFKILKYCTMFSSISNCYKIILGVEDYELVRKNETPNAGTKGTMMQRLDFDAKLMISLMQNDQVTIPSFIKDVELTGEDKPPLRVIVGCRGDSRNLTHGERTGACMRAYGHADDLFNFTNTDPRGFHLTFEDPRDGKYISRVSGFRNGNTVFLNELRSSCDHSRYSDSDVIEACKDIGRELIERSKDSPMPIENVVCSPDVVLMGQPTEELSCFDISTGVYNGYKNVSNNAVVIATTGQNNKPVPLKLNPEQPVYEPCRLPIKTYVYPNITDNVKISIQRINALKECIEHKDEPEYYKRIDLDFEILEKEYAYVIIGQDFYVALDVEGNIYKNIIGDKEKAIEEYTQAITTVEEQKAKLSVSGGYTNGSK